MMHFRLVFGAALLGFAVSAPAQLAIEGKSGRQARSGVRVVDQQPRATPQPRVTPQSRQHQEPRAQHQPRVHTEPRGHYQPSGHRPYVEPARFFPAPRFVPLPCPAPAPRGHWETVCEEVLVPGYWHEEHVPPTYGWVRGHCGRLEWGMIDPGGCRQVWVPARYEHRSRQVWVTC